MALLSSRSVAPADRELDRIGGEMAELKKYEIVVNGWPTTVQLTDEDARTRGLLPDEQPKARPAAAKARRPANKARTVADKDA